MKTDKSIKDLWKKVNNFSNIDINNRLGKKKDDDYYIATGSQPPRFVYYRHVRAKEWEKLGHKEWDHVYDLRITQDELDYCLKAKLREPPEERYKHRKENWFFHELSYLDQKIDDNGKLVDVIKEYGCGYNNTGCVPECRYYAKTGRIDDEEIIREHREIEEHHRKSNLIVKIEIDEGELEKYMQQFHQN